MATYFIKGLADYSKEALLAAEIKRVAELIDSDKITKTEFNKYGKTSASVIQRKFGGWENALIASGLHDRYSGVNITSKMRVQGGKEMSNEEFLEEIKLVAKKLKKESITHAEFNSNSFYNSSTIANRFGNWDNALTQAGLNYQVRSVLTELEFFENILKVWTYFGRQPK